MCSVNVNYYDYCLQENIKSGAGENKATEYPNLLLAAESRRPSLHLPVPSSVTASLPEPQFPHLFDEKVGISGLEVSLVLEISVGMRQGSGQEGTSYSP